MMDLATLAEAITKTLSPDPTQRTAAEKYLGENAKIPGFSMALLQLIALETAPPHVRQATAVYMKNHTINVYSADWKDAPPDDRNAIKSAIVKIMLAVPVSVRRQLSEVLAIVAEHEYPQTWPDLVPELGAKLTTIIQAAASMPPAQNVVANVDWLSLEGVLETLYVIFERYPERTRTDELYTEINTSLRCTQQQVQALFVLMNNFIEADIVNKDQKSVYSVFGNLELLCKVFYCLSWQQLPEYFEDHMQSIMTELLKILKFESAKIDAYSGDEASCIDKVHAGVLEITNHFAVHYDEEFRPYLQEFLNVAWALLVKRSNAPKYDGVVTSGIKFLTAVSRSPDYKLFQDQAVLGQICKSIVVPNIELREEDEELFEDNPVEYVRRDMEGSDTETRRRGAVELVKGLCKHFEPQVTEIFTSFVKEMLAPQSDWRKKDTALYVVTALGWKRGTAAGGATETSSLIDVVDFFAKFVKPELEKCGQNPLALQTPIFAADLIKFVISFRNQIPKTDCGNVILICVKLLSAKEPVVRTYAAACIERILTTRDTILQSNGNVTGHTAPTAGVQRMTKEDLAPLLPSLLPAIINSLRNNTTANEYMMRLVLRLSSVAREAMAPFLDTLFSTLVEIVVAVTANPSNPLFNHYLFEAIAALVRFNGNENTVVKFEAALILPLSKILQDDVTEFGPYVFQVMAQLMSLHKGVLPATYAGFMAPMLTPSMWDRRGYVPGMVQYIDVFIRKNSAAVVSANQIQPILGVFQKLLASKSTDHLGLQILDSVFLTFDAKTINSYLVTIVRVLLERVQRAKTAKLCQKLICSLSIFVLRYGVRAVKVTFDSLQENMLAMFIRQVWIPEVIAIRKPVQRRLCSVALSELACGADDLCLNVPYFELWPQMLNTNVALTEGIVVDKEEEPGDTEEEQAVHLGGGESYAASHSQLKWAVPNIPSLGSLIGQQDPKKILADKIRELSSRHPGRFEPIMQEKVEKHAREAIMGYVGQIS